MNNSDGSLRATSSGIRFAHELLFSLNIAFAFMLVRVALTPSAFPMSAFGQIKWRVNVYLHRHAESDLGARVAFFILAIVFTICAYLFLRLVSRLRFTGEFLRSGAGILAVVTPFLCWYYIVGWSFFLRWQVLAAVELVLSGTWALHYLHCRRQIASWLNLTALACHGAFWCWYFLLGFESRQVVINPIVSSASVAVWGVYVHKLRRNQGAAGAVARQLT